MALKLRLLGGARVESDGATLSGRAVQRRRLAILALLALAARRTLTRERVIAYLWPDHSPDAARRLLSEAIYVLRRELGEDVIASAGDELTLARTVECDVDDFRNALAAGDGAAAVAAYGGPFLDAWYVREAPEFERWCESERIRLAGEHARTLSDLAETKEAANEWAAAADWWQALIRLDPYSSTAVMRAARALAAAGERAAAIQTLVAHEAMLQRELGVGPDAELTELMRQIRRGDVGRRRSGAAASRSAVDEPDAADAALETVSSRVTSPPAGAPRRWPSARRIVGTGTAIVMLAATLWAARRDSSGATGATPAAPRDSIDRHRIAVMYFEDKTPGHRLRYLADGLTEYLIGELSHMRGLRVASPEAVRRLRDAPLDSVAQLLHVRTVVQARVEESGGRVRVAVRVIDASTQEQVGGLTVEAPAGEVVALEDRLSSQMALELVRWVGRAVRTNEARAAARAGGQNDRALDLLLRAERLRKDAEESRITAGKDSAAVESARRTLRRADSLAADAESLDRRWAAPPVERGLVALFRGRIESGPSRVVALAPGLGHAERAITLLESTTPVDSHLVARALYLRGLVRVRSATAVQTFRPESTTIRQGEDDLVRAVGFDSTLAGAWAALALPRWLRGDFGGVQQAATRALETDAYLEEAPDVIGWAWRAAAARGDRETADRWCTRGRRQMPDDWHFIECELTIMRLDASGLSGRRPDTARAWAIVRELEQVDATERARSSGHPYSPIFRRMLAAMVSAAAGDQARARATLAAARRETERNDELSTDLLYETACLLFILGERDAGERALADYLRARPDVAGFILRDATVRHLRDARRPNSARTARGTSR